MYSIDLESWGPCPQALVPSWCFNIWMRRHIKSGIMSNESFKGEAQPIRGECQGKSALCGPTESL